MTGDFLKNIYIRKHSGNVSKHYDRYNQNYLEHLGAIVQGSRTLKDEDLLEYLAKGIGLQKGMQLLDAGSGFGGPAIYFADKYGVSVSALTINEEQRLITEKAIAAKLLQSLVKVQRGDFHFLSNYYPAASFDCVYFFESFCHAYDYNRVLKEAAKVLKPGGCIYIKDYLINEGLNGLGEKQFNEVLGRINDFYKFNFKAETNKPGAFARLLAGAGFKIDFIREVSYIHDNFEKVSRFHDSCNNEEDISMSGTLQDVFKVVGMYEIKGVMDSET